MTLFNEDMKELVALRALIKSLGEKLEASEAREAQFRKAIARHKKCCETGDGWTMYYDVPLHATLAFPRGDSALKARLKAERERIAERFERLQDAWLTKEAASALIRNLGDD